MFCRQYMQLVGVLLQFSRATRYENGGIYLTSFSEMLPWFALYGHQLQKKFLADMIELAYTAQDVNSGFWGGDFVVKESYGPFN